MELKYKLEDMGNSKDYSSNRTFMELKSIIEWYMKIATFVLIVPLWNWNFGMMPGVKWGYGSNRTFMELKF